MINCNTKLKKFEYQGFSGLEVFLTNNKEYFVKKYNLNKNDIKKLYNTIEYYLKLEKSKINLFVLKLEKLLYCKNYFLLITQPKEDSLKYIINNISFKNMQNIFLQTLLFTFFVKYKLRNIHGDFHLRNILYEKIDKKINFKIKIKNKSFNLNINEYLIKIIDLDRNQKYNYKKENELYKKFLILNKLGDFFKCNLFFYDFFRIIRDFILVLSKKYNVDKFIIEIKKILMEKKNMWEREQGVYNLIQNNLEEFLILK